MPLDAILDRIPWPTVVWNNALEHDLAVYGRYAAIARTRSEWIYTQDDDCLVDAERFASLWRPSDRLLVNVEARTKPWLGHGAIFHRDAPFAAFAEWSSVHGDEDLRRWPDVVFSSLTPRRRVQIGRVDLPAAYAGNRMWMQPDHFQDQERVRTWCRRMRRS